MVFIIIISYKKKFNKKKNMAELDIDKSININDFIAIFDKLKKKL